MSSSKCTETDQDQENRRVNDDFCIFRVAGKTTTMTKNTSGSITTTDSSSNAQSYVGVDFRKLPPPPPIVDAATLYKRHLAARAYALSDTTTTTTNNNNNKKKNDSSNNKTVLAKSAVATNKAKFTPKENNMMHPTASLKMKNVITTPATPSTAVAYAANNHNSNKVNIINASMSWDKVNKGDWGYVYICDGPLEGRFGYYDKDDYSNEEDVGWVHFGRLLVVQEGPYLIPLHHLRVPPNHITPFLP